MNAAINAILGTLFLILAFGTVFLMYRLWGYPFDKVKHKSAAPPGLMRLHRMMGYAYFLIYLVLMAQMVPRLWTYQVEFPARTVVHIVCGILIGVVLILKLSILRFYRHFEEWMPVLGTSLLVDGGPDRPFDSVHRAGARLGRKNLQPSKSRACENIAAGGRVWP